MDWLILVMAIEFGVSPDSDFAMYEAPARIADQVVFYMDTEAELIFSEHVYLGGGAKIHAWKTNYDWTFWPGDIALRFSAGVRFGIFDIGVRHYCQHPVVPWITSFDYKPKWEAAHTEIFIRAEGRIGG